MRRGTGRDPQNIYNSKINQKEIQLRRRWGSSAKYMPNSVISIVQLRGVSRSSLTVSYVNWRNLMSGKEFELISHRQIFSVNKYTNNRIITVNNTITADNITGSDSHIQ